MIDLSDALMYVRYYQKNAYLNFLKNSKGLDYVGRIESHSSSLRGYEGCYSIKRILKTLNITNQDCFLDIGCGKGLSLYYSSMFGFERIDGIEYSEQLTHIAKQNARILKDGRLHVYNCDARIFKRYDKYNYFFINNPFSADIMEQVVLELIESYSIRKRKIIVLYQFPFSIDVFKKHGFEMLSEKFPNSVLTFG